MIEEKKRELRDSENETNLAIPPVVRIVVIRVQPTSVVIPIHIEQVRIAVKIVRAITYTTTLRILLKAESNPASQCLDISHQASCFFKILLFHPIPSLGRRYSQNKNISQGSNQPWSITYSPQLFLF
jgi:hypothetical protein